MNDYEPSEGESSDEDTESGEDIESEVEVDSEPEHELSFSGPIPDKSVLFKKQCLKVLMD